MKYLSLSPLAVFLLLYVGLSVAVGDFYKVPIAVAFLVAAVWGMAVTRGISFEERINLFSRGTGNQGLLLMIWIFVLAGAFAASAKAMGAVDATVALTLQLLPASLLLAGLFVSACFVSLSVGTSVGTIVALTPIAAGIAAQTGTSLPVVVAAVVGGALFGDNLSFISDTTIVATRTQGCRLSDKFRTNVRIVLPAAIISAVLYIVLGWGSEAQHAAAPFSLLKVLPYIVVLVAAFCGMNVLVVLVAGIVLTGVIGMYDGSYDLFGWFAAMGDGIAGMGELILITMMAGGMMELMRAGGGIDLIINALTRRISGRRGAEMSIAAIVFTANLFTANNTVAILTVGGIANQIATRFDVDKRKSASLLDTFSCLAQGLIPYGAQLLMAASLAGLSPLQIIPNLFYPVLMGLCAIVSIWVGYPFKTVK